MVRLRVSDARHAPSDSCLRAPPNAARARGAPVNAAPAWHTRRACVMSGVRLMEDLNQTPDLDPVWTPNSRRECASSGFRETWLRGGKRLKKKKREGGGGRKFFAESLCKLSLSRRGYCKLQQHGLRETGRQTIAMRHNPELPSNSNKLSSPPSWTAMYSPYCLTQVNRLLFGLGSVREPPELLLRISPFCMRCSCLWFPFGFGFSQTSTPLAACGAFAAHMVI